VYCNKFVPIAMLQSYDSDNFAITVVTVCFNALATIETTIKSVVEQKFDNYEYIIIDGGSTDGTVEVIKKHENNINYWISEVDKGIYDAMNKGLKASKGKYVYFLNSGDKFVDDKVLSAANTAISNSSVDIICGKVLVTSDVQHENIVTTYPKYKTNETDFVKLFDSCFCHQALFVSKRAYLEVGGFDLNFKVFSDFFTMGRILNSGQSLAYCDLMIAFFNNNGVSSNWVNVRALESEKKEIFKKLGVKKSRILYFVKSIKTEFFIIKKKIIHAYFNR